MGRAALKHVVELAGKRTIANTIYSQQRESVGFQLQIAEAATLIDTAQEDLAESPLGRIESK